MACGQASAFSGILFRYNTVFLQTPGILGFFGTVLASDEKKMENKQIFKRNKYCGRMGLINVVPHNCHIILKDKRYKET